MNKCLLIGISEIKVDGSLFNNETRSESYDLMEIHYFRKGSGDACFNKKSVSFTRKILKQRYTHLNRDR